MYRKIKEGKIKYNNCTFQIDDIYDVVNDRRYEAGDFDVKHSIVEGKTVYFGNTWYHYYKSIDYIQNLKYIVRLHTRIKPVNLRKSMIVTFKNLNYYATVKILYGKEK